MSFGDLLHPPEDWDPAAQVSVLADSANHWYFAHLFLFVGMLLFVPGILEITRLAATRRPLAGFAARILLLVSVGALSAVFVFEMLLGQFIAQGAAQSNAVALLETFQSTAVFLALLPGLLAFFVGTGLSVLALARPADPFRWPAVLLGIGAVFILGEIILAQVLLSQVGNILVLAAGVEFARLLGRKHDLESVV
jgi:hypothetical protein